MKLSDAIMLNGMTKPQGYFAVSIGSVDAPCAIGARIEPKEPEQTIEELVETAEVAND